MSLTLDVLKAAQRYQLEDLYSLAKDYLKQHITDTTVCAILNESLQTDVDDLVSACLELVRHNAVYILQSDDIHELSQKALLRVVQDDELNIMGELLVHDACMRWAMNVCVLKHKLPTDDLLREELGQVLFAIRYPCMTKEDFMDITLRSEVLTKEEKLEVYQAILNKSKAHRTRFAYKHRVVDLPLLSHVSVCVKRFAKMHQETLSVSGNAKQPWKETHAISFTMDKNAFLIGLSVFTMQQALEVSVKVYDQNQCLVSALNKEELTKDESGCRCYPYQGNIGHLYFTQPVHIPKNHVFTVQADIESSITGRTLIMKGVNGTDRVDLKGLTVQFSNPSFVIEENKTSVSNGQIPQLLVTFRK